jgi:hypothetical protein
MSAPAEPNAAWHILMAEPAQYIQPSLLAPCFGDGFPVGLCERMLATPRLAGRLSGVILSHYDLLPAKGEEHFDLADRIVAIAPPQTLPEIARRAGAIYWSATIANTVLAREVNALQSHVGEALCSFAIRHRGLAGPEQTLAPFDTLSERITADGWRCFAAWCAAVDPAIGIRTRLKLPPQNGLDASLAASFAESGPAIIRRAAAQ